MIVILMRNIIEKFSIGITSYTVFLTSAAKAYNFVVLDAVQTDIFNFQNLFEPSRVANDLFQGGDIACVS